MTTTTHEQARSFATKERVLRDASTGLERKSRRTVNSPDGTLFEISTLTMGNDGVPASGTITRYAPDGTTVVSAEVLDFSGAHFDSGAFVGGQISYESHDGKNRLRSQSVASYG